MCTIFICQGLVVPVIRNVEEMNFTDIEKAINLLGEKVRFHITSLLSSFLRPRDSLLMFYLIYLFFCNSTFTGA